MEVAMSRGQITEWRFVNDINNDGSIIECFGTVHGQGFGFSIEDVVDAGLANFLRTNRNFIDSVDCSAMSGVVWVRFSAIGNHATNISRG
jgi:hypothetical protein